MHSEKTTKFDEISRLYLKLLSSVKNILEILSFFVAFPEYPSQNTLSIHLEFHELFMVFCYFDIMKFQRDFKKA